jgi:hypothetical protein
VITFDHCVVAVSGWERSNAFYRDVLGGHERLLRDPDGSLLELITYG